jgi:hypothetical protein
MRKRGNECRRQDRENPNSERVPQQLNELSYAMGRNWRLVVGDEGTNYSLLVESLLVRWLEEVGHPLEER